MDGDDELTEAIREAVRDGLRALPADVDWSEFLPWVLVACSRLMVDALEAEFGELGPGLRATLARTVMKSIEDARLSTITTALVAVDELRDHRELDN